MRLQARRVTLGVTPRVVCPGRGARRGTRNEFCDISATRSPWLDEPV